MRQNERHKRELAWWHTFLTNNYERPYDQLVFVCREYSAACINERMFVRALQHMFADDHGADWIDERTSISLLVNAVLTNQESN